jgi:IS30 family transposase
MNCYQRLTHPEREEVSRGVSDGKSIRTIAKFLNRHPSTISREIIHHGGIDSYRAWNAHQTAMRAQQQKRQGYQKIEAYSFLKTYILSKLRLRWSPHQIVASLKKEYPSDRYMQISHETIYTYLYVLGRGTLKKELISYLRQGKSRRTHRSNSLKEPKIKEMVSIEERPKEVADRTIPGHWEGDIILGKQRKSQLGTLVERITRFVLLVPLSDKKAPTVRTAFVKAARTIPRHVRQSLTYDQGNEMVEHKLFSKGTKMKVYFAHPASPWERGTNENTNGLLRQFFPKGTDFNQVSIRKIRYVQKLINERPRRVLQWETPQEAFTKLLR